MDHSDANFIKITVDMADRIILLAHKGELEREDPGCGQLVCIFLELANKIKTLA